MYMLLSRIWYYHIYYHANHLVYMIMYIIAYDQIYYYAYDQMYDLVYIVMYMIMYIIMCSSTLYTIPVFITTRTCNFHSIIIVSLNTTRRCKNCNILLYSISRPLFNIWCKWNVFTVKLYLLLSTDYFKFALRIFYSTQMLKIQ